MREKLRQAVPGVRALEGTGERIPLPDRSVDTVLVAQAWHWMDPVRAVPEVARVLRPGGQLGLLWNIRDERAEWVAGLGAILHQSDGAHAASGTVSDAPRVGPPFGQLERRDVGWVHHLSPGALVDMVSSRSYVSTMPAADHDKLLNRPRPVPRCPCSRRPPRPPRPAEEALDVGGLRGQRRLLRRAELPERVRQHL